MSLPNNVNPVERAVSLVAGLTAIVTGVKRGDRSSFFKVLGGAALLQRGLSGHCALKGLVNDPDAELAYLRQRVAGLRTGLAKIEAQPASGKSAVGDTPAISAQETFASSDLTPLVTDKGVAQ